MTFAGTVVVKGGGGRVQMSLDGTFTGGGTWSVEEPAAPR